MDGGTGEDARRSAITIFALRKIKLTNTSESRLRDASLIFELAARLIQRSFFRPTQRRIL
jgi:hypothetical protein